MRSLETAAIAQLFPMLKTLEPQYTADGYSQQLNQVFLAMKANYEGLGKLAQQVSRDFTASTNQAQKSRFYAAMNQAVGIDIGSIVANEDLTDILLASVSENVNLITSIPAEYFKKIESVVYTGVTRGNTASSMMAEIRKIGQVTEKRAKLIARDQTSKLSSALNQQRQQNLGVEEYIWVTAQDDRVRPDHKSKNGKRFRWDTPPKDTGHPGQDIQCRCIAQPLIQV